MEAAGDVSGGSVFMSVTMDRRFCSLVSYVTVSIDQVTAANADIRIVISDATNRVPQTVFQEDQHATVSLVNAINVAKTFSPPPIILPGGASIPLIVFEALNVDANDYFVDALIYLFDIRVRETTAMGPLLWAKGTI